MPSPNPPFVSWYDPALICIPVWDGRAYLLATKDEDVSMPSSLVADGPSQQPAKPMGSRGSKTASRASGLTSRSALS
jgi:hypothetical protein